MWCKRYFFFNIVLIFFFFFKGSKKSAPIRLIKEACEEVESLIGIPITKSSLNNSATMESVCVELQNRQHLIQVETSLSL